CTCCVCSARLSGMAKNTIDRLRPFFFCRQKRSKKTRPVRPQQRGFCSRARLKGSKGQVVFFEKISQQISTFRRLPIFILSVLFSLPKARLSKNKIFIVFRFSSVTDKTTQK